MDKGLGVLAHGALRTGLLGAAPMPGPRLDREAWPPRDVLTVGCAGLGRTWARAALAAALVRLHRGLLPDAVAGLAIVAAAVAVSALPAAMSRRAVG